MKIIHCADIHLDSKMNTHLSGEKARERKNELLNTFQNMVKYAVENDINSIIIAGDLFDSKTISATARNIVRDTIFNYPQITFYYLQGNHDDGSFVSALPEIPENLKLFSSGWTRYQCGELVTISGIELDESNKDSAYNDLVLDTSRINIVVMHGQEAEHKSKDKAEVINLTALKNKSIDYLALGHVHSYKYEKLDGRGNYCYPGCLEGRGFDECGEHGFVVLDIDEAAKKINHSFVPFAQRNLYTIRVDISQCMTTMDILEVMKEETKNKGYSEKNLIKYELVGKVDVGCEKETEYLLSQFENAFYYVKIKDSTGYKIDYSMYEYDMSLKGEFIRTVKNKTDLTDEEKAKIIHFGIQALMGEEIVSR